MNYGQDHRDPDLSLDRDHFTVGVTAEVDLFTGFATDSKVAAARRRLAEAQALEERTRLAVEEEVRKAQLAYREALARVKVTQAAVGAAEEALRLVSEQYRGGTATVTRYLEAEVALASARARAIAARYEAQSTHSELKRATGTWQ